MLSILSALPLCLWSVTFEYASVSRFKGVFRGFYTFGVGLCYLGALRGLWGFCVREWLGGLKACGVFAFLLSFFTSLLSYFLSSFLSFCSCVCLTFCPFLCLYAVVVLCLSSLCGLLFPFPFRYIRKKKGRKVLSLASSLRVLWAALSCCCFVFLVFIGCQPVYIVIKF